MLIKTNISKAYYTEGLIYAQQLFYMETILVMKNCKCSLCCKLYLELICDNIFLQGIHLTSKYFCNGNSQLRVEQVGTIDILFLNNFQITNRLVAKANRKLMISNFKLH